MGRLVYTYGCTECDFSMGAVHTLPPEAQTCPVCGERTLGRPDGRTD